MKSIFIIFNTQDVPKAQGLLNSLNYGYWLDYNIYKIEVDECDYISILAGVNYILRGLRYIITDSIKNIDL